MDQGRSEQPPGWMQRTSLEWLHRLGRDPLRMARRYLVGSPAILPMLLQERLAPESG